MVYDPFTIGSRPVHDRLTTRSRPVHERKADKYKFSGTNTRNEVLAQQHELDNPGTPAPQSTEPLATTTGGEPRRGALTSGPKHADPQCEEAKLTYDKLKKTTYNPREHQKVRKALLLKASKYFFAGCTARP